jgi:hypothetical protein
VVEALGLKEGDEIEIHVGSSVWHGNPGAMSY